MPYCPECRTEFRPGVATCSDCQVDLVDSLPDGPPVGDSIEEVVVGSYSTAMEAEMWAELLRNDGVPSRAAPYLTDLVAYGLTGGQPHELHVRSEDVERARELLGDAAERADPVPGKPDEERSGAWPEPTSPVLDREEP